MAEQEAEGKADELETVSIDAARVGLGDLVLRAAMKDERIVITRFGKPSAALIGMSDLDRLQKSDAA